MKRLKVIKTLLFIETLILCILFWVFFLTLGWKILFTVLLTGFTIGIYLIISGIIKRKIRDIQDDIPKTENHRRKSDRVDIGIGVSIGVTILFIFSKCKGWL